MRDPRLLVVTSLTVNDWNWGEITSTFQLDDNQLVALLLKLDELKVIDYRAPRRIGKLTAAILRGDGMDLSTNSFLSRVAPEFLRAHFDAPTDEFRFVGGQLSETSPAQMKASIGRLAQEFEEYARRDARLSLDAKLGCSTLIAMREWEFSEFTRLRRRR